ncbi:hypothetical protein ABMA32_19735 [Mesorhizobium sp. VNQ89]|uniref:hypothetical protein n=1 Tax=Mesorhizobium quangtriensis TaxID=3157709 RepID=UPI0032B841BB
MRTVSALFDTYDEVTAAVDALTEVGVNSEDITIVRQARRASVKILQAIALGAAIGGVCGILVGLASVAFPGSGLPFSRLWAALVGAAAGGLIGAALSLIAHGRSRANRPHAGARTVWAQSIKGGSTLVTARIHEDDSSKVLDVFRRCGALNTNVRRGEYAGGEWDDFVDEDMWDEDIGREDAPPPKE